MTNAQHPARCCLHGQGMHRVQAGLAACRQGTGLQGGGEQWVPVFLWVQGTVGLRQAGTRPLLVPQQHPVAVAGREDGAPTQRVLRPREKGPARAPQGAARTPWHDPSSAVLYGAAAGHNRGVLRLLLPAGLGSVSPPCLGGSCCHLGVLEELSHLAAFPPPLLALGHLAPAWATFPGHLLAPTSHPPLLLPPKPGVPSHAELPTSVLLHPSFPPRDFSRLPLMAGGLVPEPPLSSAVQSGPGVKLELKGRGTGKSAVLPPSSFPPPPALRLVPPATLGWAVHRGGEAAMEPPRPPIPTLQHPGTWPTSPAQPPGSS